MEVHHCRHTQGYTLPHTSHHCQPPAVPVSVVVVTAEGERGVQGETETERRRSSLLSIHVFFYENIQY